MALSGVTVKLFGLIVGTAQIEDDGKITIITKANSDLGRHLKASLESGDIGGLNIMPYELPFPPIPKQGSYANPVLTETDVPTTDKS